LDYIETSRARDVKVGPRDSSNSSSSSRSVSNNSQHSTISSATLSLQSPHISQSCPGSKADVFTLMHWRETPTASETYRAAVSRPRI